MNKRILLLIVLFSILVRFQNLSDVPHWFWDEGANMNMAWNIAHGNFQWFTLIFPAIPHPPLYFLLGGLMLRVFGNELIVLRIFSSLLGVSTTILLYYVGRQAVDERAGLLTSFLYAIYPVAIFWDRMAFSYNLLMFLNVLVLYCTLIFVKTKRKSLLFAASLITGLCIVTVYTGLATLAGLILVLYRFEKRSILKFVTISLIPLSILLLTMFLMMPDALVSDVLFQLNRFELIPSIIAFGILSLFIAILTLSESIREFLRFCMASLGKYKPDRFFKGKTFLATYDIPIFLISLNFILALDLLKPITADLMIKGVGYYWLGIIGLFLMARDNERAVTLSYFIPTVWLILEIGRTDHMTIPMNPFIALGLAVFLIKLYTFFTSFDFWKKHHVVVLVLLMSPFGIVLYHDVSAFVANGLAPETISERELLADFLNNNTDPNDIVLVDSHQMRFLKARASVLTQGIAVHGRSVGYYRGSIPSGRFVFNSSYKRAKYVVLQKGNLEWLSQLNASDVADEIEDWSVDFRTERYAVYKNPAR